MAVVTYNRRDLEGLIGRKLDDKTIQRAAEMGAPIEELNGNEASFEVFPNRPDLLSTEGFARAFGDFLSPKKRTYSFGAPKIKLKYNPSAKIAQPYIVMAAARGISLDGATLSSLMNFSEKIDETVGRKRRKLSIGIYDLDTITPPIEYRAADPKTARFVPLEFSDALTLEQIINKHPKGQEYGKILKPFKKYPLLIDSAGQVLSMPPIINSEETRVTTSTTNLCIDITGTDFKTINQALNILCHALVDRGAKVEKALVNNKASPDTTPQAMSLDPAYVNRLLGLSLTTDQIIRHLVKMGFLVTKKKPLTVQVPPYRVDILHPIDLVEDVAIAYGYMKFDPAISETATIGKPIGVQKQLSAVREIMLGHGFNEVATFVLTNLESQFKKMGLSEEKLVTIANPRTADYTHFRNSLLPSLLSMISSNSRYELPQKFFEVGEIALPSGKNQTHIAAGIVSDHASYSEIRTYLESLASELGDNSFKFTEAKHASFIQGRVASAGGKFSALVGEIHPQVLKNFGIEYPVAVFELTL